MCNFSLFELYFVRCGVLLDDLYLWFSLSSDLVSWIYMSVSARATLCAFVTPVMVNQCEWEVALAEPQGDTFHLRAVSHRPGLLRKRSVGIRRPGPAGSKVAMFRWLRSNFWFLNGLGQHAFPIWNGWNSDCNLKGCKSNLLEFFVSKLLYEW